MDTININLLPQTYAQSIKAFIKENNLKVAYLIDDAGEMGFRDALDCYLRWEGISGYTDVILTFINAMNPKEAEPLNDEHTLVMAMKDHGGHFASAIATAWIRADGGNIRKLRREFNNLLETYRQFIYTVKEDGEEKMQVYPIPEFLRKK